MKFSCYGQTDPGNGRNSNDDYYLLDEELGLFVVCDGVSGNVSGNLAAETAAKAVREHIHAHRQLLANYAQDRSQTARNGLAALIRAGIELANSRILDLTEVDSLKKGMSTTIDVLLLTQDHAMLGHVGDSRIYLFRSGKLHPLTQDHKVGAEMIRKGDWNAETAAKSPYRNVLTRAVGLQRFIQVDTLQVETAQGDQFLLCTDGLTEYLTSNEMAGFFAKTDFMRLATDLVRRAKDKGGKDNITSLVVKVETEATVNPLISGLIKHDLLGKVPVFRYMSYTELTQVLQLVKTAQFKAGDWVLKEGLPAEEMHIIALGEVEITKGDQAIGKRGKGDSVGEMGIFDHAPRSASVRALSPAICMVLHRNDLFDLFRKESQIAVKFLWALNQELNKRLRATTQDLAQAKSQKAEATVEIEPPAG